jgi:hypothetical protein
LDERFEEGLDPIEVIVMGRANDVFGFPRLLFLGFFDGFFLIVVFFGGRFVLHELGFASKDKSCTRSQKHGDSEHIIDLLLAKHKA